MPFVTLLLVALCVCCVLPASSLEVTIHDSLGIARQHELVHNRVECARGEITGAATARVECGAQVLPCQVSDVERYADGSVQAMNVWYFADVPANGATSYRLLPGKSSPGNPGNTGVSAREILTPIPSGSHGAEAGVKVSEKRLGIIELRTDAPRPVGVRLLGGEQDYTPPQPATQVPGPLWALLLPSGHSAGKGSFTVPFLVKSVHAEVTANGPLFAEARVRYEFDCGYWTFTARVVKDSPVVIIHEEANTGYSGQLAAAADRFYTFTLNTGDFAPTQLFFGGRNDRPELSTLLKDGMREEWKRQGIQAGWFASTVQGGTLPRGQDEDLYYFTGYPSVLPRIGCLARVQQPSGDAVGLVALETAYWKEAMSLRLHATAAGDVQLRLPLQVYQQEWATDGFGRFSPNYTGKSLFTPPNTIRRAYGLMLTTAVDEQTEMLGSLFTQASKLDALALDKLKEWTLDWPDPMATTAWAPVSTAKGKKALDIMRQRLAVTRTFGQLGRFSMAYHYGFAKSEYPDVKAVIDSPTDLSAADRAELRRLCAWNAYDMNSTDTFPWGTGFHLNNPNMSVMAVEARTKSSLLVLDHPLFETWGEWSLAFLKEFNQRFTRPSGALYENAHYSLGVTLAWQAEANNILREAGVGDAFDDPLFRKSMHFIQNWVTPPDPRFNGHRVIIPYGNCSYQSVPPEMAQSYITYYQQRDPQLAGQLQWFANQTLPEKQQFKLVTDIVPPLGSVQYQDYGVFFRHGFGTPYETYFLLFAGTCDGHCEWESDQLTYSYYAKGQPINLHFGNGYFPMFCRPWLRNRVSIDHKFEVSERNKTGVLCATFNPETEYAHAFREVDQIRPLIGETPLLDEKGNWSKEESANWPATPKIEQIPPVRWHRQVLFLKDVDPKGPNYFVIGDSFGGTPTRRTDDSFWFLANAMTTAGKDTSHFDGQCGVDMDVFVANPADANPETGKYGHRQEPYRRLTGEDLKYFPDGKRAETQLLLRFKQPTGQGYLVVLYPRLKGIDPPATFTRLSEHAVRVETTHSTDYAFVSCDNFTFTDGRVRFTGLAGAVRYYPDGSIVVANSEGPAEYRVGGKTITGNGAFTVTIAKKGKVETKTFAAEAKVRVK